MNWNELSKYRGQLYGISIIWIVIFHVWEAFPKQMTFPWTVSSIIRFGNLGVEIFLFLSGISMYFAIQKYILDNGKIQIRKFYIKRLTKIILTFVMFCIPYFIYRRLIMIYDPIMFIKELFFCRDHISTFWFLLCIVICYLIYPFIYYFIINNKKHYIYVALVVYILSLLILIKCCPNFYVEYEVMLTRIPVFVMGAICGQYVYNKNNIKQYILILACIIPLCRSPLFFVIKRFDVLEDFLSIISRFYGSLIGISAIFLLLMILRNITDTKLFSILGFFGNITLEIYVVHIAIRSIIVYYWGSAITRRIHVLIFLIILVVLSTIAGYYLSKALNIVCKKILNRKK